MMSIANLLKRMAKSTAVYWPAPTWDEYGTKTYPSPEEIEVRWEDRTELIIDKSGEKWSSSSVVYVLADVELDGYLYHGQLQDLSASEQADPETVDDAKRIRRVDKIHSLSSTTDAVRMAYL